MNSLEDMSPREKILHLLSTDVLSSNELAEMLGVSRQSINWQLSRMEVQKLVQRKGREVLKNGGVRYYWSIGSGSKIRGIDRSESPNYGKPKITQKTCALNEVPKATNWLGGYCA